MNARRAYITVALLAGVVGFLAGTRPAGGWGRRARPADPPRPLTPAEAQAFDALAVDYYTTTTTTTGGNP